MHGQLDKRLNSIYSPIHYVFHKAHTTLQCLMVMLVELKQSKSSVKWSVLAPFKSQPRGQNFQAQI